MMDLLVSTDLCYNLSRKIWYMKYINVALNYMEKNQELGVCHITLCAHATASQSSKVNDQCY